jgi:hypothetical protein
MAEVQPEPWLWALITTNNINKSCVIAFCEFMR